MDISIRQANESDASILADFNCRLAAETEDKQLDRETVELGVRNGLSLTPEVAYLVAEVSNKVVGQLMLTREWSDWRNGWTYWLQSVYVHIDFRGTGVFRKLLEHTVTELQRTGDAALVRLYVEKQNSAAISTYQRLGFSDAGYSVMERPISATG